MNNQLQKTTRQLPRLEELYTDIELASKHNELNKLLNCSPKPEWLKVNKFANNSTYLPIGIIEYLLTSIFIKWRIEIKGVHVIANSVVVEVRLHVLDPITGEWDWQDGVGASPIQTAKGAAATDFSQVNTAAVQMAAPAAESYAFKDAAEKFGRLFGKDLNRKDLMNYDGMLDNKLQKQEKIEVPEELKEIIAGADKETLANIYKTNTDLHSNPEFMQLLNSRKSKLNGSTASQQR